MGRDSERAALIYLHSTDKRQRALADAARAELAQARKPGQSGTPVARKPEQRSEN